MKTHTTIFIFLVAALLMAGHTMAQPNRTARAHEEFGYYDRYHDGAYDQRNPSRHQGSRYQAPPVVRYRPSMPTPPMAFRMGPPSHRHVWMHGEYIWRKGRYVYNPGRWVVPPRRGHQWVSGFWQPTRGGFVWVSGFWTNGRHQRW